MIPTVLLLAFIAGVLSPRFAWLLIPLAGIAWAAGLAGDGTCTGACAPGAAFLASANAAVGVAVGVALGALLRWCANGFRFSPYRRRTP